MHLQQKAPAKAKPKKTTKKAAEKSKSPSEGSSGKGNVGSGILTNTEGEKYVELGKKRRATVRSFKGMVSTIAPSFPLTKRVVPKALLLLIFGSSTKRMGVSSRAKKVFHSLQTRCVLLDKYLVIHQY